MADKRMLSKKITDHDSFTSLPASAQALYMHLCLSADDDGFCNQTSLAIYKAHAKKKDLDLLVTKKYVLRFNKDVVCIKHWLMMNAIRKDRYNPTVYQAELSRLTIRTDRAYTMATDGKPIGGQNGNQIGNHTATNGEQNGDRCLPQVRLGKDRLDKVSLDKDRLDIYNPNSLNESKDNYIDSYDDLNAEIPGLESY